MTPVPTSLPSPTLSACEAFFGEDWSTTQNQFAPNAFNNTPLKACGYIPATDFSRGVPAAFSAQPLKGWSGQTAVWMAIELEEPNLHTSFGFPFTVADVIDRSGKKFGLSPSQEVNLLKSYKFASTQRLVPLMWSDFQKDITANTPVIARVVLLNSPQYTVGVGWAETSAGDELVKDYDPSGSGTTRTLLFSNWLLNAVTIDDIFPTAIVPPHAPVPG